MVLGAPPTQRHEVQILGSNFQFSGQLETVGSVMAFINDAARESFSLYDAYLTPLTPGSPLKGFSRSLIIVRRPQIVFIYFTSAETRASLRLLQREETIVAYTTVAVCRGGFHVTAEARVRDFIDVVYWPGRHWPAFNVADTMLCIAVGLLIVSSFFTGQSCQKRAQQHK